MSKGKTKPWLFDTTAPRENINGVRGIRVQYILRGLGITPPELSKLLGVKVSTLSVWCSGNGTGLSLSGARRLASLCTSKGYKCDFLWIYYGKGYMPLFPHLTEDDSTHYIINLHNPDLWRKKRVRVHKRLSDKLDDLALERDINYEDYM